MDAASLYKDEIVVTSNSINNTKTEPNETIVGWRSHEEVEIRVSCPNGHISVYKCKALDCAFLCNLLDRSNDIMSYSVYHNGISRSQEYLRFTDTYKKWKI
jgi:hypothetical protein